ncbi:MAG: class I SAM-dependent DNA methyltransferase, partial [Candidatus Delongbacteria bacterium]|nr:class I SAM-dependent DNA methyltransferase [Candidatus Delongbacteria bacterium]
DAEAKTFLYEFFNVFGISQRKVSNFEHRVKKLDDHEGYIDLFWPQTILIEMKSKGKNLDKAYDQAREYLKAIRQEELPKYILVSDFENFRLFDLEEDKLIEFKLPDLVNNVQHFGYLLGYQKKIYKEQDPANIKAAELMGKLHDRLKEIGYTGHPLEVYLVRILFCLFAEDTTIFNKEQFQDYITQRTNIDGSDLAAKLQELFQVLNTPNDKRFKNLDEQLADFPYVNGKLFEEILPTASFDSKMRKALLECSQIDWSKISPAIFGSMFQSVMNPTERRNLGAHYTSETNILKLIKPLFLDELWAEFESVKNNKNKLSEFHKKLSTLKFLDPACGCGNFLVITYRELRLLELEILRTLYKTDQLILDVRDIIWLDVDQFYGIELEEFPVRIAEVAMWLIDHQMNMQISNEFGQYFIRLPLKKSAIIVNGNALRIDWQSLLNPVNTVDIVAKHANIYLVSEKPAAEYGTVNVETNSLNIYKGKKPEAESQVRFDYILGNPPFIGKQYQNKDQKEDMAMIWAGVKGAGVLDYVTAWYIKASKYIQKTNTRVAFVSTNSISQGEQVGILWNELFNNYNIKIHFAHRTFKWSNEAKGKAAVHVVIIGFSNFDVKDKSIFEYESIVSEPHQRRVKNINPYLIEGSDSIILSRNTPICKVPNIVFGSMPNDGGFLLMSEDEKLDYEIKEPQGIKYIRPFSGGEEFLFNIKRHCFWLKNSDPSELKKCPLLMKRIENLRDYRLKSKRETTRKLALYPTLFGEIRQPDSDYIIIPNLSTDSRRYIPIGFKPAKLIASNLVLIIPDAKIYHFGVLTSIMHNTWTRNVCGMLGSGLRYSNKLVYNNFPWPENATRVQEINIEKAAQKVLDTRGLFPNSSLAVLYDPLSMPPELVKAHNELDRTVDLAYRSQPFVSEANRMEFLFELYEKYTADLFTKEKLKKKS